MKHITPMKSLKLRLNTLFFAAAAVALADLSAAEPADPDIALKPAHI